MNDTCEQALLRIEQNAMDGWRGLPDCHREAVERALGPSASGSDGMATPGGAAMAFRNYPKTSSLALYGVTVWYVGDTVQAIQINSPKFNQSPEAIFGKPETKIPSQLRSTLQQWVYASRGLALHVHTHTGEVQRLYGFAPMSTSDYEQSWLSRVSARRIPLRR